MINLPAQVHVHPGAEGSSEQGVPPSAAALVHKNILSFQLFHRQNKIFSCLLMDKYLGVGRNLSVLYFAQSFLDVLVASASRFLGNS